VLDPDGVVVEARRWRAGSRSVLLRAWSADGWEGVCWQAGALNVSELSELDEAQAALLCRQPGCLSRARAGWTGHLDRAKEAFDETALAETLFGRPRTTVRQRTRPAQRRREP
jgi:hypothetical protein